MFSTTARLFIGDFTSPTRILYNLWNDPKLFEERRREKAPVSDYFPEAILIDINLDTLGSRNTKKKAPDPTGMWQYAMRASLSSPCQTSLHILPGISPMKSTIREKRTRLSSHWQRDSLPGLATSRISTSSRHSCRCLWLFMGSHDSRTRGMCMPSHPYVAMSGNSREV